MPPANRKTTFNLRSILGPMVTGPQVLAFLPAAVLAAYWLGGELGLLLVAIGLPLGLTIFGALHPSFLAFGSPYNITAPEDGEKALNDIAARILRDTERTTYKSACFIVELDDFDAIVERYGRAAANKVAERCFERLKTAMRTRDLVFNLENGRFAIMLAPVKRLDLESGLQLAKRLQSATEEPISLDATTIYVSACAGLCLSTQLDEPTPDSLIGAAHLALAEARRHAPSAIRAYSTTLRRMPDPARGLSVEAVNALESGQIQPWFQPQISTDTGRVTGFEALARWMHPERGMIAPAEFLPALEDSAHLERLSEVMLYHAFNALKSWDVQGLGVPHVGVNFSPQELQNPRLVEKIKWDLDRFDLAPDRLVVEILETVVAMSPDDTIARNINGLSALGCRIDLDDFGTGHASISSIRRFAIHRLKIDRSFVMKVDRDPEQQRMVSAILMMAEQLELDTLAEGVETAGEHAMLAQLGCRHVQGFGISRPLPFDKTAAWVTAHTEKLGVPFVIGRKTG